MERGGERRLGTEFGLVGRRRSRRHELCEIVGVKTETVTVSENESVNALTINDAQATLAVTNGATLSVYGDFVVAAVHAIDITQGTLFLGGSGNSILDNAKLDLGGAGPGLES